MLYHLGDQGTPWLQAPLFSKTWKQTNNPLTPQKYLIPQRTETQNHAQISCSILTCSLEQKATKQTALQLQTPSLSMLRGQHHHHHTVTTSFARGPGYCQLLSLSCRVSVQGFQRKRRAMTLPFHYLNFPTQAPSIIWKSAASPANPILIPGYTGLLHLPLPSC